MSPEKYEPKALLSLLVEEHGRPFSKRVEQCLNLAHKAHQGQFRSARTGQQRLPYIVHPVGTALIAIDHYRDIPELSDHIETIVCTALLHDVLEDTSTEPGEIELLGGKTVRIYVEALSKPSASVTGRGHVARNQEFLQQIVGAGPTAVFLKLCDCLHNLSRPSSIPNGLLRKTIEKSEGEYFRLFESFPFPPRFVDEYNKAIAEAHRCLAASVQEDNVDRSLEAAMRSATLLGREKILELHDIVNFLKYRLGASNCRVWKLTNLSNERREVFTVLGKAQNPPPEDLLTEIDATATGPSRLGKRLLEAMGQEDDGDIYFLKEALSPHEHLVFFVQFDSTQAGTWVDEITLSGLVRLLLQRLVVAHVQERARLSTEATMNGLKLDVALAQQVAATAADLRALSLWVARGVEAVTKIEFFIKTELTRTPGLSKAVFGIETRVKTPDSMLQKFIRQPHRKWPRFDQLEDVAGARVVCLTQATALQILRLFNSEDAKSSGISATETILPPIRNFVESPTNDGYRGIHLIVDVETFGAQRTRQLVPCEIQIRTLCQDTWARVSHIASYRSRSKKKKTLVKTMAVMLNDCQLIVDDLFANVDDVDEY